MHRFHRIRKRIANAGAIIFYIGLILFGLISFSVIWFACKISDKLDERKFGKDLFAHLDDFNEEIKKKGENGKWKDNHNSNVIPLR